MLFERWARLGGQRGEIAAREALVRITRLYLAALDLPPPWTEGLDPRPAQRVSDDEWKEVFAAAGCLPLDYYGELFDPLVTPPEEPVIGSLADDIADIYRDVVTGLREHQAGRPLRAIWEWGNNFQQHWGDHATGAIRALHAWLAANAPARLAADLRPADEAPVGDEREPG